MEKENEKAALNGENNPSEAPIQAAAAPKKMAYVPPKVKVVRCGVERGFSISGPLNTESLNNGDNWQFLNNDKSLNNESLDNNNDWGTFN